MTRIAEVLTRIMPSMPGQFLGGYLTADMPIPPLKAGELPQPEEECKVCGGIGYLRPAVPYGHRLFGQLTECQVCKLIPRRRWRDLASVFGFTLEMKCKTFANFSLPSRDKPDLRKAAAAALLKVRGFAAESCGWRVLKGPFGSGKTHFLCAIGNAQPHFDWAWANEPDIWVWTGCISDPNPDIDYEARLQQIAHLPLLLVDEVGTKSPTDAVLRRMRTLFDFRYRGRLPTVFATPYSLEQLEQIWGDGWLPDRMAERGFSETVEMPAYSYRRLE